MQRIQMLEDINQSHLDKLMEYIHLLVKEYEAKHSSLLNMDKATIDQMHDIEKLARSKDSPQLTYYKILKNLYDTIMIARSRKHGKEKPILALHELLENELRTLHEAQLEKTEEENIEGALDGALQRLVKYVYHMRNRDDITEQYLVDLVAEIHTHADGLKHRMIDSKNNKKLIDKLKNINVPENNKNIFSKYHGILNTLHSSLKGFSALEQNPSLVALNKLLILELQTQSEAEWVEPCENNNFRINISRAINCIYDHTHYASIEEKDYYEKWDISLTHIHSGIEKKWHAVCQIGESISTEKGFGDAMQILGFKNANFDKHNNPDLFALQKDCALSRELHALQAAHAHLISELGVLEKKLKSDKKLLQQVKELEAQVQKNDENSIKASHELEKISARVTSHQHSLDNQSYVFSITKLEIEVEGTETAIKDKIEQIKVAHDNLNGNKRIELANLHYNLSLRELDTLEELTQIIKSWSHRNIALLFIENILKTQIKAGTKLSDTDITRYAKNYYLFILRMNKLANAVTKEYKKINAAIENTTLLAKQAKKLHELPKFEDFKPTDNLEENKLISNNNHYTEFRDFMLDELGALTDSFEFQDKLKKLKLPTRLKEFNHEFHKLMAVNNFDELDAALNALKSQDMKNDDYTTFKNFLSNNFSSLENSQEFSFALDSLKFKANPDLASHRDYTVSPKYNLTLYSKHKISRVMNQTKKEVLEAAINTPLPMSPRVNRDLRSKNLPSNNRNNRVQDNNNGTQTANDFNSTMNSPRAIENYEIATSEERKSSLTESIVEFVTHDEAKRPRPTWQKIGIGLLIGLGVGLVLGGIAAATMVTGGLALEIIIGVSVGLVVAGVITGSIGGKAHDYRTRDVELKRKRQSSSADIQDALAKEDSAPKRKKANDVSVNVSVVKPCDDYSVAKSQFTRLIAGRLPVNHPNAEPTVPAPLASLGGQSPRL